MSIKISHEAPLSFLEASLYFNDYDYALVHLFSECAKYRDFFSKCLKLGREVILDNSVQELGQAYSGDNYASWIEKLQPTYYIIPDVLEDCNRTIENCQMWLAKYNLPGKKIGVVQGKTYEEIVKCYKYMDAHVDKIGISFDYSYYEKSTPHPSKCISWMLGRIGLLGKLAKDGIINTEKPHHLLGASNPREFSFYAPYKWIRSLDTSSPIVHGICGIEYDDFGLWEKKSIKIPELLNYEPKGNQDVERIMHNIQRFREFVNYGEYVNYKAF